MAKKVEETRVEIPAIELATFNVKIVGDSPLIVHAWSEKAKKMMLEKQMKKASKGKEVRNPHKEYADCFYWLSERLSDDPTDEEIANATFGFPTVAFKACAINAGYQQGCIEKKTTMRGAFHIQGEYAVIDGKPRMREDMVRLGGISSPADLRYRPEFVDWSTVLTITYNKNAVTPEQIINILNIGGFSNGVGEWRPEKDGQFGMFHVE